MMFELGAHAQITTLTDGGGDKAKTTSSGATVSIGKESAAATSLIYVSR